MSIAELVLEARQEAGLTQRELAALAGTSQPAVNRYEHGIQLPTLPTLERLLRACDRELVVGSRSGRGPVHSARGGVGTTAARLRACRGRLLEAARRNGIRNVRVFGSLARGAEEARDVDLLVDLTSDGTLLDIVGFRQYAEELLEVPVDVATLDLLKPHVRGEVLADAVPL